MPTPTTIPNDPLSFIRQSDSTEILDETEEQKKIRLEKEEQDKVEKERLEKEKKEKSNKGGKDESVAELRRRRDKLEEEKKELEEKLKKAEALKELEPLKPIAEYLTTKLGKVDEEAVNKFIEKGKKRKADLADYDKRLKEKDGQVKDLQIEFSDEWREDFAKPIAQANDNLRAIISNFDKENKIKHPELIAALENELKKVQGDKLEPLTSVQVKAVLQAFEAKYSEVTKEEYEVPRLNDVVDAIRSINAATIKAIIAKQNWTKTIEEKNKTKAFEQAKQTETLVKRELEGRQHLFRKALDSIDLDPLTEVFDKEEIKNLVEEKGEEAHTLFTKMLKGEEKPLAYDDITTRMIKASLYDTLVEKLKQLNAELTKEKKKSRSGLRSDSLDTRGRKDDNGEQKEIKPEDAKNPISWINP